MTRASRPGCAEEYKGSAIRMMLYLEGKWEGRGGCSDEEEDEADAQSRGKAKVPEA